ncbi:hypothetical protein [Sphingobium sp.]|uniref:hypothetical protein n=1 Tax=Sphingobium sp. TaxID=1912891 RepID=UPI002634B1B7|nr:hypothetical protein [Sphingobium sp.]
MAIRILRNVPANEVAAVTQLALDTGATSVTPSPETDGEFTLMIVYPDQESFAKMRARVAGPVPPVA